MKRFLFFPLIALACACGNQSQKQANPEQKNAQAQIALPVNHTQNAETATEAEAANSFNLNHIQAPFKHVSKGFERFVFDNAYAHTFRLPNGSRIHLPENAFCHANGAELDLDERVTLSYREFHDAADLILGGIPMAIQTAKAVEHLETGGMFDIRANSNGKTLKLNPGKRIKVELASYVKGNDYQHYFFDPQNGWKEISKTNSYPNPYPQLARKQTEKVKATHFDVPMGNAYFVFNYESILDIEVLPYEQEEGSLWLNWQKYTKDMSFGKNPSIIQKVKAYGFEWAGIQSNTPIKVMGNEYPAGMILWKKLENKNFPAWAAKGYYAELKADKSKGANVYEMKLDNGEEEFYMDVEAVMPLKDLYAFSPEYWKNNRAEALAQVEAEEARVAKEATLLRAFDINQMGIYNVDKIMREPNPVLVKADFRFPTGKESLRKANQVYYIPANNRSVIVYNPEANPKIALSPSQPARLLTVLADGSFGIFDLNQFKKIPFQALSKQEKPSYTFDFIADGRKVDSEKSLRAVLGIW